MNPREPQITVLIPVRNGARFVEDAVRSAAQQTFRSVRILVSDNQSTDATPRILERLAADPRIAVVRQPAPLTMLRHFNDCLLRVDTEFFMLLCHDDFLASDDALRLAREALLGQPDVNAVYCDLQFVNASGKPVATRRFGRTGRFPAPAIARSSVITGRNLFGIPLLVRTSAARGLSYDESLTYAADVDMSIAVARGGSLFHLPAPLIANRYHEQNATWGVLAGVSGQMKRIAAKHGIALSALERARAQTNAAWMALAKMLFFAYMRVRR